MKMIILLSSLDKRFVMKANILENYPPKLLLPA